MKKILLLGALLCSMILHATAQHYYLKYPESHDAEALMKRPVIIQTKEIDSKERKKLEAKDPEQLQFEEAYNEYYHASLKHYFEKEYKGSNQLSFKTASEVEQLMASGTNQYTIIKGGLLKRAHYVNGRAYSENTFSFELYLSEKKNPAMTISFLTDILTDPDYLFLVQQLNNVLADAAKGLTAPAQKDFVKEYAERAKGKTLYISTKNIPEKLTQEAISSVYKHPIKFIDDELEYDSLILTKTQDMLYITSTFSPSALGINYLVVAAETGTVYLNFTAGGVTVSIGTRPTKEQGRQMGLYTKSARNQYYSNLLTFKPKLSFTKTHYTYLNSYATIKEPKKK